MKAWRKHNSELTTKIREIETELQHTYAESEKQLLEQRRAQLSRLYLRTKTERRGQFAAEVAQPSQNLYILFMAAGLPVPPDFAEMVRSHVSAAKSA